MVVPAGLKSSIAALFLVPGHQCIYNFSMEREQQAVLLFNHCPSSCSSGDSLSLSLSLSGEEEEEEKKKKQKQQCMRSSPRHADMEWRRRPQLATHHDLTYCHGSSSPTTHFGLKHLITK